MVAPFEYVRTWVSGPSAAIASDMTPAGGSVSLNTLLSQDEQPGAAPHQGGSATKYEGTHVTVGRSPGLTTTAQAPVPGAATRRHPRRDGLGAAHQRHHDRALPGRRHPSAGRGGESCSEIGRLSPQHHRRRPVDEQAAKPSRPARSLLEHRGPHLEVIRSRSASSDLPAGQLGEPR
jgi:hypothetical protein